MFLSALKAFVLTVYLMVQRNDNAEHIQEEVSLCSKPDTVIKNTHVENSSCLECSMRRSSTNELIGGRGLKQTA